MRLGRAALTLPVLVALVALLACAAPAGAHRDADGPLVIGHRGAAGYLPDHTLEGYALAIGSARTTWSPTSSPPRTAS